MNTRIVKLNMGAAELSKAAEQVNSAKLREAAELLRRGELVVFPTETVYGLGANIYCEEAYRSTYSVKGRPSDNPLIIHVYRFEQLEALCEHVPAEAITLAERFWPGPLTMVFKKKSGLPDYITAGLDTVAVRMPSHPVARTLLKFAGVPVSAPSANLSGKPSPTRGEHVAADLNGKVSMIIDSGSVDVGLESTVLDVTCKPAAILRVGSVTREEIADAIGEANVAKSREPDSTYHAVNINDVSQPRSPGQKYRHYAPDAPMFLLKGSTCGIAHRLSLILRTHTSANNSGGGNYDDGSFEGGIGILSSDEVINALPDILRRKAVTYSLGSAAEPKAAAERLYDALRFFDSSERKIERIYCEYYVGGGMSAAIGDRMFRAASGNVIDVDKVERILFVCTGNTCRSAMAEALFNKAVLSFSNTAVTHTCNLSAHTLRADSAGVAAFTGDSASEDAILTMSQDYDIDISSHRARRLTTWLTDEADLILTMTHAHKNAILSHFAADPARLFTISEFSCDSNTFFAPDIPDPYGLGQIAYRECASIICTYCAKLVELLCANRSHTL